MMDVTPQEIQGLDSVVGTTVSAMQLLGYVASFIMFIVGIALLIKSIIDIKKLNEEASGKSIKSVKVTSIILLILNILTICNNFIMAILAIISIIFASKAQKLLVNDAELAKSKAKTASALNIVITALMILSPIIMVLGVAVLNMVWMSTGI